MIECYNLETDTFKDDEEHPTDAKLWKELLKDEFTSAEQRYSEKQPSVSELEESYDSNIVVFTPEVVDNGDNGLAANNLEASDDDGDYDQLQHLQQENIQPKAEDLIASLNWDNLYMNTSVKEMYAPSERLKVDKTEDCLRDLGQQEVWISLLFASLVCHFSHLLTFLYSCISVYSI